MFTNDIVNGTLLYTILAIDTPTSKPVVIGQVTSTSGFVTSTYGDKTLQFKHTAFEKDLKYYPSWKSTCSSIETCKVCPVDASCDTLAPVTNVQPR